MVAPTPSYFMTVRNSPIYPLAPSLPTHIPEAMPILRYGGNVVPIVRPSRDETNGPIVAARELARPDKRHHLPLPRDHNQRHEGENRKV